MVMTSSDSLNWAPEPQIKKQTVPPAQLTQPKLDLSRVAQIAHEVNRVWCEYLGDNSQPRWENAPEWQKKSAIDGVMFHATNPEAGDDASHNNWMESKKADGWVYGKIKDPQASPPTHPCLVPFEDLPLDQQFKDKLFRAICTAAID